MSVTVTQTVGMSIAEVPPSNTTFVTTTTAVTFDGIQRTQTLTASTTPACSKTINLQKTMSGGAGTIDLTSAPGGVNGATVDGTGLKVCGYLIENPSTNANNITITGGASNGYLIFGTAGSVILSPGEAIELMCKGVASTKTTIDSTHKNIDIAGTGSQVLNVQILMG